MNYSIRDIHDIYDLYYNLLLLNNLKSKFVIQKLNKGKIKIIEYIKEANYKGYYILYPEDYMEN